MTLTAEGLRAFAEQATRVIALEIVDRDRKDEPAVALFVGGPADGCEPSARQLAEWGIGFPLESEVAIALSFIEGSAAARYRFGWRLSHGLHGKIVYLYDGEQLANDGG